MKGGDSLRNRSSRTRCGNDPATPKPRLPNPTTRTSNTRVEPRDFQPFFGIHPNRARIEGCRCITRM